MKATVQAGLLKGKHQACCLQPAREKQARQACICSEVVKPTNSDWGGCRGGSCIWLPWWHLGSSSHLAPCIWWQLGWDVTFGAMLAAGVEDAVGVAIAFGALVTAGVSVTFGTMVAAGVEDAAVAVGVVVTAAVAIGVAVGVAVVAAGVAAAVDVTVGVAVGGEP